MRFFSRLLFAASCVFVHAVTAHAAQWSRTYGPGTPAFIQQAADGSYVVGGHLDAGGWLVKLDSAGNVLWKHTIGGGDPRMQSDGVMSVQRTAEGGYVVFGGHFVFSIWQPTLSPWLLKLDTKGNGVWSKGYAGIGWIGSVQPSRDGGWIAAGWAYTPGAGRISDALVLKFDADGDLTWGATYGGDQDDVANSVYPTYDGGYIVAGRTSSTGEDGVDAWVAKLNEGGQIAWQKSYGGPGRDAAQFVVPTTEGGFLVVGQTSLSPAGPADAWVLKLDGAGEVLWQRTYGGAGDDAVSAALPTWNDGGIVVAGSTSSFGAGETDVWLFAIDAGGNLLWQRTFGGVNYDSAASVQQTGDGGYIVAGTTGSFGSAGWEAWVLKLDATGAVAGCPHMGLSRIVMADGRALARDGTLVGRTFTATPSVHVGPVAPNTEVPSSQQCFDPLPASRLTTVEYYHRDFDHYFVTTLQREIDALDAGAFPGWARTGLSFEVYGLDRGAASVCRFWSGQTFMPKSSHFYTPYAAECAYLKQQGVWQYEGDVFALGLPVGPAGQGTCGTTTQPLYRAYNNGQGGAPNHRYTTDPATLDAMLAQGWTMEGEAATRVFACVPPTR